MSRNKKPRKAYRPRQVAINTLDIALHHAAVPSKEDRATVTEPIKNSLKAIREGVASHDDWSLISGSVQAALAIERKGIVRGLQEHLQSAEKALQSMYNRAMASGEWKPTALYFHELDALTAFAGLHKFQISKLGRSELNKAIKVAERQVRKDGHVPTVVRGPINQGLLEGVAA